VFHSQSAYAEFPQNSRRVAREPRIPSFQSRQRLSDDIIVPLGLGPPRLNSISIMRPETKHVTNQTIEREAFPREANGHTSTGGLRGKTLLYSCGNCASPNMEGPRGVTDYVPLSGLLVPPKSKPLSVLAAIPAFNEGPTIGSVVLRAKQFAEEVVVIDDGSRDDTAEIAALAGAHVIQHARNLGKGTAIRTAWLFARERHPEALVLLDGDHQHDPKDIPRIVKPILAGKADVVLGVRWGKTSGMPAYRRLGKRILDYATSAGVRRGPVTDSQCGFRAFSRTSLDRLEPTETGLAVESQILIEAQERKLRIYELEIDARYDLDGSTYSPGRHGMTVLSRLISLVSVRRPLFFFGLGGGVLLIVAILLGLVVLQTFYATRNLAIGYSFIVILFTILGVLSIFVGVILNAFKRMINQQRPPRTHG